MEKWTADDVEDLLNRHCTVFELIADAAALRLFPAFRAFRPDQYASADQLARYIVEQIEETAHRMLGEGHEAYTTSSGYLSVSMSIDPDQVGEELMVDVVFEASSMAVSLHPAPSASVN